MRINPVSALALITVAGFTLGCLGGGDAEGDAAASDGGFWNNFGAQGAGASDSPDSDGDGLTDAEELDLGTDPNEADSDGDGWDDGEEIDGNTDPTSKKDHPYEGGWAIAACRHDFDGDGDNTTPGNIADQFELQDQFDDTVRLHDFCDREVVLIGAAYW